MRVLLGIGLSAWLVIGSMAAGQRGYFGEGVPTTCTSVSHTTLTLLAGPLNYQGLNPGVECELPTPSV